MKTYTEFQNRRKILLNLIGDGIAIISNSDESSRNRDCDYPFRSDSYFHYLSGFPEPEAAIFIVGGDRPRSILFCKPKDIASEIFHVGHQARSTWSFDVEIRPDIEVW